MDATAATPPPAPSPPDADPAVVAVREAMRHMISVLAGPEPAVALPPSLPPDIRTAVIAGRVLVETKQGMVAVRPDPACRECRGSTAYRMRVGDLHRPCRCVWRHLEGDAPPVATGLAVPATATEAQPAATAVSERNRDERRARLAGRVATLENQIADAESRRDAALSEVDERLTPVARECEQADCAVREAESDREGYLAGASFEEQEIVRLQREIEFRRGVQRECLTEARAIGEKRLPVLVKDREVKAAALAAVQGERDRIAAHHEKGLHRLRTEAARLRARMERR